MSREFRDLLSSFPYFKINLNASAFVFQHAYKIKAALAKRR